MSEPVLIAANNNHSTTICDVTKTDNVAVTSRSTSDEVDVPFTDKAVETVLLTGIKSTASQNPPTQKELTEGYSSSHTNVKFGTVHVHVHPIQESRNDSRSDKMAQNVIVQLHRKPHEAVTSSTTTLDDVITAHLERASKQMKAKHKDELNNNNNQKKKQRWWFFCEMLGHLPLLPYT